MKNTNSPAPIDPADAAWLDEVEPGWRAVDLPFLAQDETFVSGDASGRRITARYYVREEDGALVGKAVFGPGTQGPPGHAHGGAMAALMDEAMGSAAWQVRHPVVAAKLDVEFRAMIPLGKRCLFEATAGAAEGRKVRTRVTLRAADGDTEYCRGEGLFIVLEAEQIGRMPEGARQIVDSMRKRKDEST